MSLLTLDEYTEQWLESVQADNPSTTRLAHRFTAKMLRDWDGIDEDTAEIIYCDGAGDGGIDAAVFLAKDVQEGIEGDKWMLVQSKYGSAMQGVETILLEAQKVFSTLAGQRASLSGLSAELVERIQNFLQSQSSADHLEYVLVTSRRLTQEERAALDDVRMLGRAKWGERFEVQALSIETLFAQVTEEDEQSHHALQVKLQTPAVQSGQDLWIGATPLTDIYHFMQTYERESRDLDVLYERNVRKHLGSRRKVNKAIEKTLEDSPERFGLYNNGITIVADQVQQMASLNELLLINPYIVNGCQTTRSIWNVLKKRLDSGGSAKNEERQAWERKLAQGVVVTKIVAVGKDGEDLLNATTRATNSQNQVLDKDFIALEKGFKEWASQFAKQYGVFLEIQRGAWDARRAFQKQHPDCTPRFEEMANAFDLLKAFAAGWLCKPGIAYAKNPPFAPGGILYKEITGLASFGVNDLYAAWLMQKQADSYGFGRRTGDHASSRGQTRYLFIMVAIELMQDFLRKKNLNEEPSLAHAIAHWDLSGHLREFCEESVSAVDEYLRRDTNAEDTLFTEPGYRGDMNAFLKNDRIGRDLREYCPNLGMQIALAKRSLSKTLDASGAITALNIDSEKE